MSGWDDSEVVSEAPTGGTGVMVPTQRTMKVTPQDQAQRDKSSLVLKEQELQANPTDRALIQDVNAERKKQGASAPAPAAWDDSEVVPDNPMYSKEELQKTPAQNIGGRLRNLVDGVVLGAKAPFIGGGNLINVGNGQSLVSDDTVKQFKKDAEANAAKPGGFGGQVVGGGAVTAPLMLVPGTQTLAGQAAIGGLAGLTYPAESATERAANTVLGVGGAGLGSLAGKGLNALNKGALTAAEQEAANAAGRNSLRDASLKNAFDNGYTIPRSEYNPTFLSNRLESAGGKAAIKQEAVARNQEVSNSLAKKALGISEDRPLSVTEIEKVRNAAYGPYKEVAALPATVDVPEVKPTWDGWNSMSKGSPEKKGFDPKQALEDWKQTNHDVKAKFNQYSRSADPDHLAQAKELQAKSEDLNRSLIDYAQANGRADLVPKLQEARKMIAKTYTVEQATNSTTGDIDARVIGRLYGKGKPLSDGLDTIGRFAEGFPKYTGYGPTNPAPGVSKVEAMMGAASGAAGAAATHSPGGLLAAGIPLLSHPARAIALSNMLRIPKTYSPGLSALLPSKAARVLPVPAAVAAVDAPELSK